MFTSMKELAFRQHTVDGTKFIIHAFLVVETGELHVFAYKGDVALIGEYAEDGFTVDGMQGLEKDVVKTLLDAAIRDIDANPNVQSGSLSMSSAAVIDHTDGHIGGTAALQTPPNHTGD